MATEVEAFGPSDPFPARVTPDVVKPRPRAEPWGFRAASDELPEAHAVEKPARREEEKNGYHHQPDNDVEEPTDQEESSAVESGFKLVLMVNEMMKMGNDLWLANYRNGNSTEDPSMQLIQEEEKKAVLFSGAPFLDEATLQGDDSGDETDLLLEAGSHERSSDPFAPRKGKTLTWTKVNMVVAATRKKPERSLLHDVWGEVPKKETTAILGPSGAGKSSLLNILSGRARTAGRLKVTADVRLNNFTVDPTNLEVRKMVAFVAQDDSLQTTATPREAIRFSAKLRLPRSTTDAEIDQLTHRMLTELGLLECADTIVGGLLLKGISGGERKRTSVGVELVTKPAMVFLDEPTSGLDSFSAVQVCEVLRKVARAGASVLFTIHQPSSEIFASFDHLILLNKGRVMYQGSTVLVPSFFAARGHPCPPNYNPADWIMYVAQTVPVADLDQQGFFPLDEREMGEALKPDAATDALGRSIHDRQTTQDDRHPGYWGQVKLLLKRELVHVGRDKSAVGARMTISITFGTVVGLIFWHVGETSPADNFNLQSHFGAIMIGFLFAMLGTAQPALLQFPDERPVFLREYSTNHYSVLSYFTSRLVFEAVVTAIQTTALMGILYNMVKFQGSYGVLYSSLYVLAMSSTALAVGIGAASGGNSKLALTMLPVVFMPQVLFSGFFISPNLIPKPLRWLQYIMPLAYAVRIAVVDEFYDCSDQPLEQFACRSLTNSIRAYPEDLWYYWLALVSIFVVARLLALIILRRKASKFY